MCQNALMSSAMATVNATSRAFSMSRCANVTKSTQVKTVIDVRIHSTSIPIAPQSSLELRMMKCSVMIQKALRLVVEDTGKV